MTIYHRVPVDLTPVGGPKEGKVWDGIVQEVDIPTGTRAVGVAQLSGGRDQGVVLEPVPSAQLGHEGSPYDYIHLNSIDVEPNGNLLVSGRNTHTVYEIDKTPGRSCGGSAGRRAISPWARVRFAWQHDARRQPDGTISIFDNGAAPPVHKVSRVL